MTSREASYPSLKPFGPSFNADALMGTATLSEELASSSLAPYQYDDVLEKRLGAQNRIMRRNPAAADFIGEALAAHDDESLITVAGMLDEALADVRPDSEPPVATILSYLTLCGAVFNIRNHQFGNDAPSARSNAITQLVARKIAARIPDDQVFAYMLSGQYLDARIERAQFNPQLTRPFLRAKIKAYTNIMNQRAWGITYAEALPVTDKEPVTPETIAHDSEQIAQLFKLAIKTRQHGITPGFRQHYLGGCIVFDEPFDVDELAEERADYVHPLAIANPAVAYLLHSAKPSLNKVQMEQAVDDTRVPSAQLRYRNVDMITALFLQPDGELCVDQFGDYSLRDIFVRQGKYGMYRAIQADILASFFDLTHSLETVQRVKQQFPTAMEAPTQGETGTDAVHKMLLPRLRVAMNVSDEITPVEQPSTTGRHVRYHGVTWSRRRLPEGWSASPSARAHARAAGIVLEPNETFIQAHHRGSQALGSVVAHEFVARTES